MYQDFYQYYLLKPNQFKQFAMSECQLLIQMVPPVLQNQFFDILLKIECLYFTFKNLLQSNLFITKYSSGKVLLQMMEAENEPTKPVLIYFNIRGNAQIIRSVLVEIGVQFQEVFVTNEGYLSQKIIKKYGIEIKNLPYLIHDGNAIYDVFPIIKYLCLFYNRSDLLGKNVEDIVKIVEILVKYSKQRNTIMSIFMQGIKEIQQKKLGDAALFKLADVLTSIVEKNKYFKASQKMYLKTGHYLCGYLTILDFIFYQKCFYFVNMLTVKNQPKGEMTRQYVRFYENTEFYRKNKQFLEKYKIFVKELDSSTNALIQKMWIGDKKYLANF